MLLARFGFPPCAGDAEGSENDGLNMLIVECEMFAAHMNNLGSSAVDQSGARDLNVLRGAKICLIGGEGALNRG